MALPASAKEISLNATRSAAPPHTQYASAMRRARSTMSATLSSTMAMRQMCAVRGENMNTVVQSLFVVGARIPTSILAHRAVDARRCALQDFAHAIQRQG